MSVTRLKSVPGTQSGSDNLDTSKEMAVEGVTSACICLDMLSVHTGVIVPSVMEGGNSCIKRGGACMCTVVHAIRRVVISSYERLRYLLVNTVDLRQS